MKFFVQLSTGLSLFVRVVVAMQDQRDPSISDVELKLLKKSAVCCLIGCYTIQKYHEIFKDACNSSQDLSSQNNDKNLTPVHGSILCCWSDRKN